jgi:predicted RNase H-like HicB family nuclease
MALRVIYVYDDEADAWGFRIPSLGIVGSGATRAEAEERARAGILFTLEDDTVELLPGEEVGYFHVTVEKMAAPRPAWMLRTPVDAPEPFRHP